MRCAVAILALGSLSAQAMGDDAAQGTASLVFEGNQAVTDKQLRSAILLDPVCVLAIRDKGAAESLELIAERLRAGYLMMGYSNAEVRADRDDLALRIVESHRFRCGEVSVECDSTVPASEVMEAIYTRGHWERGSFASFPISAEGIEESANAILDQYGFFGASIEVVSEPNVDTGVVELSVRIQPGLRSTIADVEIQGTEKNVPDLIGAVREKLPTPRLLDAVRTRLSESKRFRRSSVVLRYPIAPGAPTQLHVSLVEPRAESSDVESDEEIVLNRFSEWLDDWSAGLVPHNVALDFTVARPDLNENKAIRVRAVLSNSGESYLSLGDDPEAPDVSLTLSAGVVENVVWGAGERFRLEPATLTGNLMISSLPPGSDQQSQAVGGLGLNNSAVQHPFQIGIEPKVLQRDFKLAAGPGEHLHLQSESAKLVLERTTGRLVEYRIKSSNGLLDFSAATTLESAEGFVASARAKAAGLDQSAIPFQLARVLTVDFGLPPHLLASFAPGVSSLKQMLGMNGPTFRIPIDESNGAVQALRSGNKWGAGLLELAVGCGPHADIDGTEFTLLRAVAMRTLGHPQLASAITEPFVGDTNLGPVNCWLAAWASLPNRTTFAERGLKVCSPDRIAADLLTVFGWSSGKAGAQTEVTRSELTSDPLIGYVSQVIGGHLKHFAKRRSPEASVLAKKNQKKKNKSSAKSWLDKPMDTSSFAESLRSGKRRK